jgi:hypothetical protein
MFADAQEIVRRLEAVCARVRLRADRHEQQQQWEQAADAYSNLGYRYYTAAELVGVERIYSLAVYMFEKSKFFRAKAPSQPKSAAPNAPEPGYRLFEADGFIYGASAKLTSGTQAIELLSDAARALAKAAQMTFGQMRLHMFYNSASHYFDALRMLQTAQIELNCLASHLSAAAASFHECFPVMQTRGINLRR